MHPSIKYPYGMEKIKNFVVLVPAFLFIYCGGHIVYDCFYDLWQMKPPESEHTGFVSLACYFASLGVETGVIFKNIQDS